MQDTLRIRALTEQDFDGLVARAGGIRAHPDAAHRQKRGADYLFDDAIIELKLLDEDGFAKPERQAKLAELFKERFPTRPVIPLDRNALEDSARRRYDRIIEAPIKGHIASARKQLKQSRAEIGGDRVTILLLVNVGFTALSHDELGRLARHRIRQDSSEIDWVIVAGMYLYSDGFDSRFIAPFEDGPMRLDRQPRSLASLKEQWSALLNDVVKGFFIAPDGGSIGPVIESSFEVDEVVYVLPAPPMGYKSTFYVRGRPRINSSGITVCPPVAQTFPDILDEEWSRFATEVKDFSLADDPASWRIKRRVAARTADDLHPFVPVQITWSGFVAWCLDQEWALCNQAILEYAAYLISDLIQPLIEDARERSESAVLPSRYILVETQQIGRDEAFDVSDIFLVVETADGDRRSFALVSDIRAFHEHALALGCAYALRESVECVRWILDTRYKWE